MTKSPSLKVVVLTLSLMLGSIAALTRVVEQTITNMADARALTACTAPQIGNALI